MKHEVRLTMPGNNVTVVGTFDTPEEAGRCAQLWREDYRLKGQVVKVVEKEEQA